MVGIRNTIVSFWDSAYFQGLCLLVSGTVNGCLNGFLHTIGNPHYLTHFERDPEDLLTKSGLLTSYVSFNLFEKYSCLRIFQEQIEHKWNHHLQQSTFSTLTRQPLRPENPPWHGSHPRRSRISLQWGQSEWLTSVFSEIWKGQLQGRPKSPRISGTLLKWRYIQGVFPYISLTYSF